mgnify:CR=1 FL=1
MGMLLPIQVAVDTVALADSLSNAKACPGTAALVNPIAAAVGSLASAWAVYLMVTFRARDARQYRYRRIVLEPSLDAVPKSLMELEAIVERGRRGMEGQEFDLLPHGAALDQVRTLIDQFNERFYPLRSLILNLLEAWGDETLRATVDERLLELQDKVTLEIEKLATNTKPSDIGPQIGTLGAGILRILAANDID